MVRGRGEGRGVVKHSQSDLSDLGKVHYLRDGGGSQLGDEPNWTTREGGAKLDSRRGGRQILDDPLGGRKNWT